MPGKPTPDALRCRWQVHDASDASFLFDIWRHQFDIRCQRLLEDVRIKAARRHLANWRLPLTQLAAILGYSELSAFSRAFRRSCGMSPRRWQSEVLRGREPRHDLTTGRAPPG